MRVAADADEQDVDAVLAQPLGEMVRHAPVGGRIGKIERDSAEEDQESENAEERVFEDVLRSGGLRFFGIGTPLIITRSIRVESAVARISRAHGREALLQSEYRAASNLKPQRGMTRKLSLIAVLLLLAAVARADWTNVAPGIDYQEFADEGSDIHVTRVDLTNDALQVVVTRESERGLKVSEFAKKNKALVAVNGDYFDDKFMPIGLTIGPCGPWEGSKDTKRE